MDAQTHTGASPTLRTNRQLTRVGGRSCRLEVTHCGERLNLLQQDVTARLNHPNSAGIFHHQRIIHYKTRGWRSCWWEARVKVLLQARDASTFISLRVFTTLSTLPAPLPLHAPFEGLTNPEPSPLRAERFKNPSPQEQKCNRGLACDSACARVLRIGRGLGVFPPFTGNRSSLMPASSTFSSPALRQRQTPLMQFCRGNVWLCLLCCHGPRETWRFEIWICKPD